MATAQTLKGGIRLVGSSASASVSALALEPPPQWNGAKTTSGRTASVIAAVNRAFPRRVVSSTTSSGPMACRGARSGGVQLHDVVRADGVPAGEIGVDLRARRRRHQLQAAGAPGLCAGLVLREHPAGGEHVGVLRVGPLVRVDVLDAQEAGAAVGG